MGVSTDGQLAYGVIFEEGYEFPWHEDEFDELEDWWCHCVNDYPEWHPGMEQEEKEKYWDGCKKLIAQLPVEEVNICSGDYPIYMLALRGTIKSASRGYPEDVDPEELVVTSKKFDEFMAFLRKHNLSWEDGPAWYLSSYSG